MIPRLDRTCPHVLVVDDFLLIVELAKDDLVVEEGRYVEQDDRNQTVEEDVEKLFQQSVRRPFQHPTNG